MVETTTPEHHMSGTVAALIATGAAVGAAGALAARRRNRVKWSEYEPSQLHSDAKDLLDSSSTATTSLSDDARGMGEPGMIKKAADWTKDHAQLAYDSVRRKIHEATADHGDLGDDMGMAADKMKDRTGDMTEEARGSVRKANEHLNEGASHFGDKTKDKPNESSARRERVDQGIRRFGRRHAAVVEERPDVTTIAAWRHRAMAPGAAMSGFGERAPAPTAVRASRTCGMSGRARSRRAGRAGSRPGSRTASPAPACT